jgi:hypothetical protein
VLRLENRAYEFNEVNPIEICTRNRSLFGHNEFAINGLVQQAQDDKTELSLFNWQCQKISISAELPVIEPA